jgi:hypothetical protein
LSRPLSRRPAPHIPTFRQVRITIWQLCRLINQAKISITKRDEQENPFLQSDAKAFLLSHSPL